MLNIIAVIAVGALVVFSRAGFGAELPGASFPDDGPRVIATTHPAQAQD